MYLYVHVHVVEVGVSVGSTELSGYDFPSSYTDIKQGDILTHMQCNQQFYRSIGHLSHALGHK